MRHLSGKALVFLAIALFSLSFTATAQDSEESKSNAQDDLDFAINLARYRYFDLANDFVTSIKKGHLNQQEEATLLLTNAQIYRWQAEHSRNREEQYDSFKLAIEKFNEFVEYNTTHPDYNEARMDLAVLFQNLGRFLGSELEVTEDLDRKNELRGEAEGHFREGVKMFNQAGKDLARKADAYRENGEIELADKFAKLASGADYKRGIAYYFWSQIYNEGDFNREDYLNKTIETLDEYIWNVSEDDFNALWAYLYQGMAYTELKDFSQALDLSRQIYDPETGIDLKIAKDLAPEVARLITELGESAFLQVAKIYNRQGEYENAISTVNQLISRYEELGLEMGMTGDRALLQQAEAYSKMGNRNEAGVVATKVTEKNENNEVGREAKVFLQNLIEADIGRLDSQSADSDTGSILSPEILFSAAEGARIEGKHLKAILGFHRVFSVLQTVEKKKEFTAKCWYNIGQCFSQMNRYLEASLAYKEGFTDPNGRSDEDHYKKNGTNWYYFASKRFKETRHPYDEQVMKSARKTLVDMGISTDLLYFIAREKFDVANMEEDPKKKKPLMQEAIDGFGEVKTTSLYYEKSLIYLARCFQSLENFDEAIRKLDSFADYVKKTPTPGTPKQKSMRSGALAEASFYRAEILLTQEKYNDAYALLVGFEDLFTNQSDFFDKIIYFRIQAKLGLGMLDDAEKLFKDLEKKFPKSSRYAVAMYRVGKAFKEASTELRSDDPKAAPSAEYVALLKKGADYMAQYCEKSGYNSFANFRSVCDWYKELGDFKKARESYERLVKEFGKDPKHTAEIEKEVNRAYGEVLLDLRDFKKARPIWLRLLAKDSKNPGILRNTARCLGGWLERDGKKFIEIPGSGHYLPEPGGDPKKVKLNNSFSIWSFMLRGLKVEKAYQPEWWEAKLQTIYCLYMDGEQNPQSYNDALKLIKNVALFHEDLGGPEFYPAFKYIESSIRVKLRTK